MNIQNPILPGFHPDPSICRVGETFYIATSTFEWFPGVEINASTDLQNWSLVARPLDRAQQLDMRGEPDSCGVWAPSLSFHDGLFWLIYTDVKRYDGHYKDTHNYLVTAPSIEGPWSDAIYLNSSGFDASLFHDDDGRKWLVNMDWDHRGGYDDHRRFFAGILLQEYGPAQGKLVGEVSRIFAGTEAGFTEAPHLLKHEGQYYLCTAEGGTGYGHCITYARADALLGPYELHPETHVLTARATPEAPLQRTGHGQLVKGEGDTWWHTFLCSRPLPGTRLSPLGRETGITKAEWRDGWLHLEDPQPTAQSDGFTEDAATYAFNGQLPSVFQWLRSPDKDRLFSLTERTGALRVFGRESVGSYFEQGFVARRQTGWRYSAETLIDYQPRYYQTMAGLIAYYNRFQFHYLYVSTDQTGTRHLKIQSCIGDWPEGQLTFALESPVALPEGLIELGVDVDLGGLQFRWRSEGGGWHPIGPLLDASVLSDEAGRGSHANFTGAFVGMAAQDLNGSGHSADFLGFNYRNRKE